MKKNAILKLISKAVDKIEPATWVKVQEGDGIYFITKIFNLFETLTSESDENSDRLAENFLTAADLVAIIPGPIEIGDSGLFLLTIKNEFGVWYEENEFNLLFNAKSVIDKKIENDVVTSIVFDTDHGISYHNPKDVFKVVRLDDNHNPLTTEQILTILSLDGTCSIEMENNQPVVVNEKYLIF